jgi:hypothetical protein
MTPPEIARFRDEAFAATLEIAGLLNAQLRMSGVAPAVALDASNQFRELLTTTALITVSAFNGQLPAARRG